MNFEKISLDTPLKRGDLIRRASDGLWAEIVGITEKGDIWISPFDFPRVSEDKIVVHIQDLVSGRYEVRVNP